ncbi:hypothetical protein ERJ70_15285 [Sediminibacillus dalangtanensis]|uniref:Uncharacterized protein n=2 Tax=Sediminibacillus TaxID=482460 RepID=A0ABX7VUA1_9BACI|nr:hypothetical protein [Sediminibacillus dalangtanensis]QTN00538.1 hypothetical protein ERJ70_15285 [Sediminibacillus dalangtanensis]
MDVKYIPADWDRMKDGLGDLIGLGRWGKGMIDDLKDITENLEDAESDIAKYDRDGVISFSHIDREGKYQSLFEDFKVLHDFSGKVGDIVDRTIDAPFHEDIDAFVTTMRDATISNYTTKNRIDATEQQVIYQRYGMQETREVPKAEVSLDDLLSGDNFYAEQLQLEYDMWKAQHPDQEFTQEEYRMAAVNMNAFEYESIKDQQHSKEFWVNLGALVVIVGAAVICPPAGLALGAAYGSLELKSAISGEDWISGRELGTGERWLRGALSPLDIVPGVAGLKKFSGGVRVANQAADMGQFGLRSGIKTSVQRELKHVGDMITTAGRQSTARLKSAGAAMKDRAIRDAISAGKAADSMVTSAKNITSTRNVVAMDELGKVHMPAENTHFFENKVKDTLSKTEGMGVGSGTSSNLKFKNAGEYFDHINKIGRREDLTIEEKFEMIHEAYAALEVKGDVTVVSDLKFLKDNGFVEGRMNIDWPDKMGFAEESIQSVSRSNPLPEYWDRVGGKGGENFTTLPYNGVLYTYDERAIPYLENPSARHVGTFDNESYFEAIDAIKTESLEELNKIAVANGKEQISEIDFDRIRAMYNDFQVRIGETVGKVDATYGLKGTAAPWTSNSTGEQLMNGGAEQIVTPLNAETLEMIGVIPNY